ncbi:remorin 4.1 [Impatiens glandulifera]|uniref:remorin 4.1 n=1 Tax=Impatiens glandulifera TaxID=253017 RepID=UPI001FB0E859|nr:remorin 4.1 [Impatiens glandulifera]
MRSVEDKGCLNNEIPTAAANNTFEFHKPTGPNRTPNHLTSMGKPTPSKWDDAQKWLVNLSKGSERNQSKTKPRNSNADDRRLIAPVPKKEDYSSGEDEERRIAEENGFPSSLTYGIETKNVVDCDESIWRINKTSSQASSAAAAAVVRSICVRDMGTEMTPMVSQEPSRTATPIRASTPAGRSPISSPARNTNTHINSVQTVDGGRESGRRVGIKEEQDQVVVKKVNSIETKAMAWDEAERAKYTARFKREEVKIQAWENHEKRKAEMEMKRMEGKAERLKTRAEEKLKNKLASTRRIAEEKRANAESKLNEKAIRTSERADYIRRTGHLPSSISLSSSSSFKFPSFCS